MEFTIAQEVSHTTVKMSFQIVGYSIGILKIINKKLTKDFQCYIEDLRLVGVGVRVVAYTLILQVIKLQNKILNTI